MGKHLSMDQFPVSIEIPVLWGDMDAFQHVNNARFFRYLESARIAYTERIRLREIGEHTGIGPILAETSCKFVSPLVYPDTVIVGCRTQSIVSPSEIEQQYLVLSKRENKTAAVGTAKIAAFDYTGMKKTSFPQEVISAIREIEAEEV